MKLRKKLLVIVLALSVVFAFSVPAMAADATPKVSDTGNVNAGSAAYTYNNPTEAMKVDDNIITASAHRANSPSIDMFGLNAVSGFGMINGSAPSDLASAQQKAAIGIWGTSLNDNPDPYYWNYFYNFYAKENGKEISEDALINANVAASPIAADTNLVEEYGNISVSLYTRPDITVGVKGGYDDQIATINSFTKDSPYYQEGDETYTVKQVAYDPTDLSTMITTMHNLADAITDVMETTGKTTRYGEDPQEIADKYENYIYGVRNYVLSEIAKGTCDKKVVAVLNAIEEDGTFTLSGEDDASATSKVRSVEYASIVSDNLVNVLGKKNVTAEELAQAEVIINMDNTGTSISSTEIINAMGDYYKDQMIINTTPTCLYGLSMNSVENAMGLAYFISYMYSDELDMDPVEWCAYFYKNFYHVSSYKSVQQVVKTNFGSTTIPENCSTTLAKNYASKVQTQINQGLAYKASPKTTLGFQKQTVKVTASKASGKITLKIAKTGKYAVKKYEVYRSTKKNGTYTKVGTTTKTTFNAKTSKTYYYKVRGVRTVDGATIYTGWSAPVKR